MPTAVPTQAEFEALEARVSALEANAGAPPEPEQPPDPGQPPSGIVKAKRVADAIELFGVNTFSSLDENNVWGSWPADYRPETVIAALRYLTGGTQFCLGIREYHYSGREAMQRPWLEQVISAFPETKVTICVGANGSVADVPSMFMPGLTTFYEGLNEPNTDFGSGEVPVDTTLDIQRTVWQRAGGGGATLYVMGPSVVAGMPHPEGWITGYFGSSLNEVNSLMTFGNGHYYPPHCPDLVGDGTSLTDYVGGLWSVYAQHPIMITEFHPTLYNSDGNGPGQGGWNGERDAYYTLLTLFRAVKCGVTGLWWYALFDYGETYTCGLFPKDASNPRPAATALRSLCTTCADVGADFRLFQTAELPISVTGPTNAPWDWDLYQSSDGTFFLPLWLAANDLGGPSANVTITLASAPRSATMVDLISGHEVSLSRSAQLRVSLNASANVIVIKP